MSVSGSIRIGTRGSKLALRQAAMTVEALQTYHPGLKTETVIIKTTGDAVQDRPLADIGGKGLFCKELEQALLARDIDCAVHSLKDMETTLPHGLSLAATLPREDPRDAFIARPGMDWETLPPGSCIGTGSIRREAQLRALKPDWEIMPLRGNVGTRIAAVTEGKIDATLLACAGLKRLGLEEHITDLLPPETMLPAACQGIIGLECRENDPATRQLLESINDPQTMQLARCERALLHALDGSCRTPVGALAVFEGRERIKITALLASPDGTQINRLERSGSLTEAEAMASKMGRTLRNS